ncbi:putative arabinose-binding protein [Spirochaetia bacterium]|nr:putative arabinose-binding protein [Spirochaetia bacterium]
MKRMEKAAVLLGAVFLFFAVTGNFQLAAGGGSEKSGGGDGKATPINFWLDNEIHQRYFQAGVDDWNARNPARQAAVNFEHYPTQELSNKLLMSVQSGAGAPDIADININNFANFLKGKPQLAPLDRIVNPVRSQFVSSRFDCYSKNGVVYGLPTHVGATVVYYNKSLTDLAGIDIDKIETWDQFEAAGKAYVAKTGKPFVGVETANQRPFWPMIVQRGGDYLDKNGNVVLDSQINIEVLQRLNRWLNVDKIAGTLPGGATSTEECFAFINQGGIAALIMPMWYMSRFLSYMPDLEGKIYLRPMPVQNASDARSAGIGGTGTAVTLQSKVQDLAIDLLGHLKLTRESNIRIWEVAAFDPPRWDIWETPQLQKSIAYFGNEKVFDMLYRFKDNIPSPNYGDLSADAQTVVMNTVMYQALVQKQDPATVLRNAAAELRAKQ